jgi:hypothetical protein
LLQAFLSWHQEVVQRTCESVASPSSCVTEADINKWFHEVEENIKEKELEEAMSDLSRTFKGDETFHTIKPTNALMFKLYFIYVSVSVHHKSVLYKEPTR